MGKLSKYSMAAMLLVLLHVATAEARARVYDIRNLGGRQNSDITQALKTAFKEVCGSGKPGVVTIPKGKYNLGPINFKGPCKSSIDFNIQGTVIAQTEGSKRLSWISFTNLEKIKLYGGGVLDGQGHTSWAKCKSTKHSQYCNQLPNNLGFYFVNGAVVRNITSKDSKHFHSIVYRSNNVIFQTYTAIAPKDSPNTNGIHVDQSTLTKILDSTIKTGDDCVSLADGCKNTLIQGVRCGPGHGLSIGNLGRYQNEQPVVGAIIRNCTLSGTQNGARIKTLPTSFPGHVSEIHFEDLILSNVRNPIVIDQAHCQGHSCKSKQASNVKIGKVSFKNIRGSSKKGIVMKLHCSPHMPCDNVVLKNINITSPGGKGISQCRNVKPTVFGTVIPPACSELLPL